MCGIVGYTGPREAGPILIEGLQRLEYRGYDSAGIALVDEEGDLFVEKKAGKLANLQTALADRVPLLPQQQRAVKARHKDQWEGDPAIQRAIRDAEERLGESGRVLVRPSGTEPALRVMVEGPDADLVIELADAISSLAGERLN